MAKRTFKLTETERKELLKAYQVTKDAATRTRYQAVRLYGEGYAEKEVEQITGCSRTSLMEWCRAYREAHSQGLVDSRSQTKVADFEEQLEKNELTWLKMRRILFSWLEMKPDCTYKPQLASLVSNWTNADCSS